MQNYRSNYGKGLITFLLILLLWSTSSLAGGLTLAWDPNASVSNGLNLIGYNLYYKAGSSVSANLEGANLVYVPLTDPEFEPNNPSYRVAGLSDSEHYYFVVTAMYDDNESGVSNEVSAVIGSGQNSSINAGSDSAGTDSTSSGSSSGGCFIDSLR